MFLFFFIFFFFCNSYTYLFFFADPNLVYLQVFFFQQLKSMYLMQVNMIRINFEDNHLATGLGNHLASYKPHSDLLILFHKSHSDLLILSYKPVASILHVTIMTVWSFLDQETKTVRLRFYSLILIHCLKVFVWIDKVFKDSL